MSMDSKFNLIKHENQLDDTSGEFGDRKILSVGPNRDVSNFSAGQISFKFACDAAQYVDINKLALSANISLLKADGSSQLTTEEGIGLAPDGNCLFDRLELLLNSTPLDSVSYPAQCAGYLQRSMKPGDYLNGFAQSTNNWGSNLGDRVAEFASDGLYNGLETSVTDRADYWYGSSGRTSISTSVTSFTLTEDQSSGDWGLASDDVTPPRLGLYHVKFTFFQRSDNDGGGTTSLYIYDGGDVKDTVDFVGITASTDSTFLSCETIITADSTSTINVRAKATGGTVSIYAAKVYITELPQPSSSSSGVVSERIKTKQVLFQPALPLIQKPQKTYLPAGQYELRCTPNANWKTAMVQSTSDVGARTAGTDYSIDISNMRLHVPIITGPRLNDTVYLIDYEGLNCQPQNLSDTTASQEKQFSVPVSTKKIAVAWQSQSSGTNTLYPPSLFTMASSAQSSVNNLLITYAGQSYPSSGLLETGKDSTALSDLRNVLYSQAYDCVGNDNPESKTDWSTRGNFGVASFIKDASSEATDVIVRQSFSTAPSSGRALLFSEYRRVAQVTINNGRTTLVEIENA